MTSVQAPSRIPTFGVVLAKYRPLWTALYSAADTAFLEAADKFGSGKHSFDGSVHAADVRLAIRDYLDRKGIEAEEETNFEREWVNNCGLSLRYQDIVVKVYKSDEGEMPQPRTRAQKRHYRQEGPWQYTLWSMLDPQHDPMSADVLMVAPLKLVAHWHMAPFPSLRLINLMLALPNGEANLPYWNKPLPHPVPSLAGVPADTGMFTRDDNIKGITRLPFTRTGDEPTE